MTKLPYRTKIIPRFLIGIVLFFNLQCAFLFYIFPERYALSFAIPQPVGAAMIQGLAILFFMWNVPYVFAILDPQKNRLSLWQAVIMQAIGVFGESSILVIQKTLPIITQSSLQRFIIFDAVGLILLVISLSISKTD